MANRKGNGVEGEFYELRLNGVLRSWACALRGSEKCALRANSRLAFKPARLARDKWPCGICISPHRASMIVSVRSGALATRQRQTRREAGAQSPWTSPGGR